MEQPLDAIILGAGAAGMMCAAVAGQRGRRVLLADHADAPGKKILISGGGRCNFTNIHTAADRYLSANPHFAKSALGRYSAQDFLALVDRHGIAWHEKTLGQLFCDGSAKQIVAMLQAECDKGGVTMALGAGITGIDHGEGLYRVTLGDREHRAPALVLATGGPSIPKLGATGFAYDVARRFGLSVVQPRPALVPFTLGPDDALFQSLSGVSADVAVRWGKTRFREAALFTHRGLSGPAMLQISSYWQHRTPIQVDFLPDRAADWLLEEKRARPRAQLRKLLGQALPERLADALLERAGVQGELGALSDKALRQLGARLADW
ncbi:MAG: aminoacetone oxidase family FAD-binding enzyme, partial [Pseudomonadota bacterium]|nr:aminoacetone oxidase family FAD-binding enzyme [Pseudomonadota bacterium]